MVAREIKGVYWEERWNAENLKSEKSWLTGDGWAHEGPWSLETLDGLEMAGPVKVLEVWKLLKGLRRLSSSSRSWRCFTSWRWMQQLWNLSVDWPNPQELAGYCLNSLVCLFVEENCLFVCAGKLRVQGNCSHNFFLQFFLRHWHHGANFDIRYDIVKNS